MTDLYRPGWRIIAERKMWRDGLDLYIFRKDLDKRDSTHVVVDVITKEIGPGQDSESSLFLRSVEDAAQELMDSLWTCGIRPTEGKGSAGQLEAVKYHLEDMRRMVFKDRKDIAAGK